MYINVSIYSIRDLVRAWRRPNWVKTSRSIEEPYFDIYIQLTLYTAKTSKGAKSDPIQIAIENREEQ